MTKLSSKDVTPYVQSQVKSQSETLLLKILKIESNAVITNFIEDFKISKNLAEAKVQKYTEVFYKKFAQLFENIFKYNQKNFLDQMLCEKGQIEAVFAFFKIKLNQFQLLLKITNPKIEDFLNFVVDFLTFEAINMQMSFFLCYYFGVGEVFEDEFAMAINQQFFSYFLPKNKLKDEISGQTKKKREDDRQKPDLQINDFLQKEIKFDEIGTGKSKPNYENKSKGSIAVQTILDELPEITQIDWQVYPKDDNQLIHFDIYGRSVNNNVKIDKITESNLMQQLDHVRFE